MDGRLAGPVAVGRRGRIRSGHERRVQDWPRRSAVLVVAGIAVALGALELLRPHLTAHVGPGVLAATTAVMGRQALRRSRGMDRRARVTWRAFAGIAALLALGQLIRAVTGAGVNPTDAGLSDLPLAATGPVALYLCVHLVRSSRGRVRPSVVLDASAALVALGVLMEMVVPVAVDRSAHAPPLLTVGYPAVSAVLCVVGLVTFTGVSPARRRAAAGLLICFTSLAMAMVAGALAAGRPTPALDVVTSTCYLAMLVAGTRALAVDPGPSPPSEGPAQRSLPLAGVLVSYCLSFAVTVLVLARWAAGRPVVPVEVVAVAALLLLAFTRSLMWAADGARLTRQVMRAEAYFRSLVHRAADVTVVLDGRGEITWVTRVSGASSDWGFRDLDGKRLEDFVHPDDLAEFARALRPDVGAEDGPVPVFRIRTRVGAWRSVEVVSTMSAAGLPEGSSDSGAPQRPDPGREGLVLHLRDVADRRRTELELERLAFSDYLTGLPNRARVMAALATARARAEDGDRCTLLLLDLDGFKPVNDIAGHDAGDRLLIQVAERLRATVRDRDLIGRLGGDEFAVLVRAGIEEAGLLAERIVADVASLHPTAPTDGHGPEVVFDVSASIGLAPLDPRDELATTIRHADLALRAAKAAGKNCVRRHGDAADTPSGRRARLAEDLPDAIGQGQLRLVFQPVVGILERRVLGLEALVRWRHPLLGEVPPDEFISLAEADGLIVPIQRWVLEQATATLAPLLREGRDLQLGVNVSVRHLQAGCLVDDVAHALAASGVPARRLMIEITESVLMRDGDRMDGDLGALRDLGCILSLDDFGKGYSSLARLARLPVDVVKIDRDFVAHVEADPRTRALLGAVIDLGTALGVDMVAEGVETTGQLTALRDLGCRFMQGYLLGRPVPPEELPGVLDGFDPGVLDPRDALDDRDSAAAAVRAGGRPI